MFLTRHSCQSSETLVLLVQTRLAPVAVLCFVVVSCERCLVVRLAEHSAQLMSSHECAQCSMLACGEYRRCCRRVLLTCFPSCCVGVLHTHTVSSVRRI